MADETKISCKQYQMLKLARKDKLFYPFGYQSKDLSHLKNIGAVETSVVTDPKINKKVLAVTSTGLGHAAEWIFYERFLLWWIPVLISIAALIVSIVT